MEVEVDSGPYTQVVGLTKSLHSLVKSVQVSTLKCCKCSCMDSWRWMCATTVYCVSRIRRLGLWFICWNQTSAFLCYNRSSVLCPIIGQPILSLQP